MGVTHGIEKSGKGRDVTGQSFVKYLPFQIATYTGFQGLLINDILEYTSEKA
jgi:hypothetical protein